MAKTTVAQLPARLYELLSPLSPEERSRVVQATLILFGEGVPLASPSAIAATSPGTFLPGAAPTGAGVYFDEKAPATKGEALAVAARFRELVQKEESHSKADLKKVITDARRNFDDTNFARDLDNAKGQSGFFTRGTGRGASKLSYYGQQFVDALPDREAVSKLSKPRVNRGRKKATQKQSARKRGATNR